MKSLPQDCGARVQVSANRGWSLRSLCIHHVLEVATFLLCLSAALGGQEPSLQVNSKMIPVLTTLDGQHFSQALITKHAGDRITFEHQAGLETRRLAEFNETNLDRIFPGLLARKAAARSEKEGIEKARNAVMAEADRKAPLQRKALEERLEAAIAEALRPVDAQTASDDPLVCVLVSSSDQYELGDVPYLAVRIVNRSSKEVLLMRELPSCGRPHFPKIDLKVTDPSGKPFTGFGSMCGTMGDLQTRQFVSLPPGGVLDPKSTDIGTFHLRANRTIGPGTYKVSFEYSTSSRLIGDYIPWTRAMIPTHVGEAPPLDPTIHRLLTSIDHVDLRSKTLELSFRPRGIDSQ